MSNFNPKYDDYKKDGKIYIFDKKSNEDGSNYRMAETFCDIGIHIQKHNILLSNNL